jgi:hypothetical protein
MDSLACQDEFFMNNPPDIKQNDEHAIEFALHLSRLFFFSPGLGEFGRSLYGSCFLPRTLV